MRTLASSLSLPSVEMKGQRAPHAHRMTQLPVCRPTDHSHFPSLGMHYLHAEAPVKVIHRDLKSRNGERSQTLLLCMVTDVL